MRNPAALALDRPRVVLLATLLFVLFGMLSWVSLPRQENPEIAEHFVEVQTYLPGAEPAKVELLVTKVLEDKIAEVDDIEEIVSDSGYGGSWMLVEFNKSAPVEERFQQARDKVQEARALFPPGVPEPEVNTESFRTNTLLLAMTGRDVAPLVLRRQAKEFKRALEYLADVRSVTWVGQPEEEVQVDVDLRKLSRNGLPLSRVVTALAERNVLLPGGELPVGTLNSPIRTTGAFEAVAEVRNTYLGAGENGLPMRLADVAAVRRGLAEPEVLVRSNGTPAVCLGVEMLPRRNVIALGERVRALIAAWETRLPEGVAIHVIADEPTYVHDRLSLLTNSLLLGMVLVVALIMLGMGWRSGLIISLSIPLSLTIAMGGLSLAGISLHQISIAALVIAVGLVVDEAIVVTDNIQRHLDRGASPREAAITGLGEIHLAVLAGAATTIAAFIPLAMMRGDIGDFIRSIPIAVSVMLLASVAVAHYFTPLFAAIMHGWSERRGHSPRTERHRFEPVYHGALEFVRRHTATVLVLFVVAFGLTVVRLARMKPVFFPAADRHQFLIDVNLPTGAALEETADVIRRIEEYVGAMPEVERFTTFIGQTAPKFYYNEFTGSRSENVGMLVVNTTRAVPIRETGALVARLDRELKAGIPGARVHARELQQGYGAGQDIAIFILGDNLAVLRDLAARVRKLAEQVPGTVDVRDSFGFDPVTLEANVDSAKANLLGISHADVATTLRTAIDGVVATTFREDDEEIDIRVRLAQAQRRDLADLATLPIYSARTGRTVPLAHVASLAPAWTTRYIQRYQRRREAVVTADVKGRTPVEVAREIEDRVRAELALPAGYEISFHGEIKEVRESFISLAQAALVAVFLIYIILVVRFNSLAQPLLIILAIPMALIGAVWGLTATGNPLGFMSFLGMIALTGIVVNDSIVLLDYINTLRSRGMPLEEAVVSGATTRLRAVTLTSATTIGGLLPLSITGGAFWAPFGFAMIFGLTASTVLTLLVQPAAYLTLVRYQERHDIRTGVDAPIPVAAVD